jgi:photosystem II stability/assembly factor-like uncharacterized protein
MKKHFWQMVILLFVLAVPPIAGWGQQAYATMMLDSWAVQQFGGAYAGVDFVDADTGWVVGQKGMILKTTDGGATWVLQDSKVSVLLYDVDFVNEFQGWAVGEEGTILNTVDGGTTWNKQTCGVASYYNFFNVHTVGGNTAWAVGSGGVILKTTSGGACWTKQTSGTTLSLNDVYFPNPNAGWAVGANRTILKTVDGGTNWTLQQFSFGDTEDLIAVSAAGCCNIAATHAWAVGEKGIILNTTNGGTNWQAQNSGTTNHLKSVHFINVATGWAVGDKGTILRTTNGGANWQKVSPVFISPDISTINLQQVQFVFSSRGEGIQGGWAVGTSGIILKSTSTGASWTAQVAPAVTTEDLQAVHFRNTSTGLVAGKQGTVLKTTNGGQAWDLVADTSLGTTDFKDVDFPSTNRAWIVSEGSLFDTYDGGDTWFNTGMGFPGKQLNAVYFFPGSSQGWLAGETGILWHSNNGVGVDWTDMSGGIPVNKNTQTFHDVYFVNGSTGWVVGTAGTILKTTDSGQSWTSQPSGITLTIYGVHFVDVNTGYAAAVGSIRKTTNGGQNWAATSSTPPGADSGFKDVHFVSANTGWVVSKKGIFKTSNGGTSWKAQSPPIPIHAVHFVSSSSGWAVGDSGLILKRVP